MGFTDIVQVVTQIVTTITAVVTAYLAYKTYFKAPEQENESEPESASDESAAVGITEALMFKTSKQKTWLSVTDQGLACRIDDTRAGKVVLSGSYPEPNWKLLLIPERFL